MLKVDIEGAEYNLIPCLAQFTDAGMVDRMYLEEHWWFPSITAARRGISSQHASRAFWLVGGFEVHSGVKVFISSKTRATPS